MIATTIDCQKLQDWRPRRLYCHFRLSVVVAIANCFLRARSCRKPQIIHWNCHPICHSSGFDGHIAISDCHSLSQSLGDTLFGVANHGRKSQTCRWNFDVICCSSSGITISGFRGHVAISGCRSMLQSLVGTFCELALVENPWFDIGIVMISVILAEI